MSVRVRYYVEEDPRGGFAYLMETLIDPEISYEKNETRFGRVANAVHKVLIHRAHVLEQRADTMNRNNIKKMLA